MTRAAGLLAATVALVAVGCVLYAVWDLVGWAQCLWVLASGSAGAGVIAWLDRD